MADDETFCVLVCGGRDFNRTSSVYSALDALLREHGGLVVIEGGATGADRIAAAWTRNPGCRGQVGLVTYPANWNLYGKRAGMIRNQEMLRHPPDLVLAFPGDKGTADMVRRARADGIEVREHAPREDEQE